MSVQAIMGRCDLGTSNAALHWGPNGLSMTSQATQTEAEWICSAAGTFNAWRFELTAAPGGAVNRSIEILKNNVVQITLTWTPAQTLKTSSTPITVAVGDVIVYRFTCNVGPVTANCIAYCEFTPTTANQQIYGGGDTTFGGSPVAQSVFSPRGVAAAADITGQAVPVAGDFKRVDIRVNTTPAGGSPMTWNLVKNGTVQDGSGGSVNTTITISNGSTTGSWTGTVSVVAGDVVYLQETQNGNAKRVQYGIRFDSSVGFVISGSIGNATTALSYIATNGGAVVGDATQANVNILYNGSNIRVGKLYFISQTAPGGANARNIKLHKNSSASSLSATITGAATSASDLGGSVTLTAGDTINFTTTNTASPAATSGLMWTLGAGLANAGGGAKNPTKGGKGGVQVMSPGAPLLLNYGYGTSVDNP